MATKQKRSRQESKSPAAGETTTNSAREQTGSPGGPPGRTSPGQGEGGADGSVVHHRPRIWVLAGGALLALCYLAFPLSIIAGAYNVTVLAILGILPVALVWRFKYWRARKTPYVNVVTRGVKLGGGPGRERYDEMVKRGGLVDENEFKRARADAIADEKQRAGFTAQMMRHLYNFSWGAMLVMYVYPIRDAIAEWRASKGKGRGSRI